MVKKVKEVIEHGMETSTQQNIVVLLYTPSAHLPILFNPTASLHLPPITNTTTILPSIHLLPPAPDWGNC